MVSALFGVQPHELFTRCKIKPMKTWIYNTFKAERIPFEALGLTDDSKEMLIAEQRELLENNETGDPKPYASFTVEDLLNRGIIGIYTSD